MNHIPRILLATVVAIMLWGQSGCTCCSQVPVSLEPINNWLLHHGPACRTYPYSCEPCPYCCGHEPAGVATAEATPAQGTTAEGK